MANLGIGLGGFARGRDRAIRTRLAGEEINIRKEQIAGSERKQLFDEAQSTLAQMAKNRDLLLKAAMENAPLANRSAEGKKAFESTLQVAQGAHERIEKLALRLGQPVQDFGELVKAARFNALNAITPEQAALEEGRNKGIALNAQSEVTGVPVGGEPTKRAVILRDKESNTSEQFLLSDEQIQNAQDRGLSIELIPPGGRQFQTKAGKKQADIALAKDIYGADSPQAKAISEAASAGDEADVKSEAGLRKEFSKLSGPFITIRDSFTRITSLDQTAAGDLGLIFSFMKMLDPGSVVREGEQATARNAAGVPDRIRNIYNRIITGEALGADQREDFRTQAGNIYRAELNAHERLEKSFRSISDRTKGVDGSNVVIDFVGDNLRDIATPVNTPQDVADEFNVSIEDVETTLEQEGLTPQELAQALRKRRGK